MSSIGIIFCLLVLNLYFGFPVSEIFIRILPRFPELLLVFSCSLLWNCNFITWAPSVVKIFYFNNTYSFRIFVEVGSMKLNSRTNKIVRWTLFYNQMLFIKYSSISHSNFFRAFTWTYPAIKLDGASSLLKELNTIFDIMYYSIWRFISISIYWKKKNKQSIHESIFHWSQKKFLKWFRNATK